MESTLQGLEFQMVTYPEIASQLQDEAYQRYIFSDALADTSTGAIKETVNSWEQKTRTLSKSAQKLCIQRIRTTALEALRDLEFRVTLGSRTNLSEAAARWIKQLNDIGLEYCEPKKEGLPPIEDQIGELELQPRIPRHVSHSMGTLFTGTIRKAQSVIDMARHTAGVAGEKFLDSISETLIPSAFAEEPPPYQPPKETSRVRFDDLWLNYEYLDFGRRPDWMNNSCAANMSHALLAARAPDMKAQRRSTARVEDESLLFRLRDLDGYLRENDIGTPTKISDPSELAGRRGIVYFKGDFGDATGHVTLWSGSSYHPKDRCCQGWGCNRFFYMAEAVYFYEFPPAHFE